MRIGFTSTPLNDQTWNHVAWVWNASGMTLFFDGVAVGTSASRRPDRRQPHPGPLAPRRRHWHLDEGAGTDAADSTGTHKLAELSGATWATVECRPE